MVVEMRPYVRALAKRYERSLPRGIVDADDLEQEGMAGVIAAAQRWDADKRASWATFAHFRAFGAMRDYLRKVNLGGRHHWREVRMVPLELCIAQGDDNDLTLMDVIASDDRPLDDFPDPRLPERLGAFLGACLTLEQQTVVAMRFEEDMTLAEIGELMGVSESAMSVRLAVIRRLLGDAGLHNALGV